LAGFFNQFFSDVGKGFVNGLFENPTQRDYQHASKTFRTNAYAYAPKFKYLFHVYFDINFDQIGAAQSFPVDRNFGLTVKTIDLPKYTFETQELNQYNRKRIVQSKIKYDPIQVVMHDDNANLIRQMWYVYYTYYYKDATQPDSSTGVPLNDFSGAFNTKSFAYNQRNIYAPSIADAPDWGYIGESVKDSPPSGGYIGTDKPPFFKAINIYGFNQHNFVLYRLLNPLISAFSHDTYNYSEGGGTMQNSMTLQYETVKYYSGAINGANPQQIVYGFGTNDHYDKTLSPIARPGSQQSILGPGGLADAGVGIIEDLQNGNFLGAIQTGGRAYNTFKNGNIKKAASNELAQFAVTAAGSAARNARFLFPTAGSTTNVATTNTPAGQVNTFNNKPPTVTF
jgi:hypothetical protein